MKDLDYEIWERFKKGDEKAFSYIFDSYHLQLFEYGRRFTADEYLVKDSIQDLFLELARKKDKLGTTNNILFYLLKALRQKVVFNLNKQKNISSLPEVPDKFQLTYSTEVDVAEKELRLDQLAESINKLPARQKETIYLKFYKNLSNNEIAEIMQVNYQSVSNNIQKAIHKLKTLLESDSKSVILFLQTYIR